MPGSTMYVQQQHHQYQHHATYTNYSFHEHSHSTSVNTSSYLNNSGTGIDALTAPPGEQANDSANSILQSVKEQEAQFERLTKELEAERRSVADQLEQCKVGSQSGSIRSLNSSALDHSYNPYGSHQNGNDSSHLVDSCLRVLQDRGIMESDDFNRGPVGRGKTVAFDTPQQSDTQSQSSQPFYNGFSDRNTASPQSSQNSYRQPEGNGMSRSQANYSLNSASATNNYSAYPPDESEKRLAYDQRTSADDYRDYREPPSNLRPPPHPPQHQHDLSDGDYVDSTAAADYMQNYGDYQDHEELSSHQSAPSYQPGQQNGDDYMYQNGNQQSNDVAGINGGNYSEQGSYRNPPYNPQNQGDYIEQGSYRQPPQVPYLASEQGSYRQQREDSYRQQTGETTESYRQQPDLYASDTQAVRASREQLRESREQLRASQEPLNEEDPQQTMRGSRDQLSSSQQLRRSQDHLEGNQSPVDRPNYHSNPNYQDGLYPAQDTRQDGYNGPTANYDDLYNEKTGPLNSYSAGRQPSYNEKPAEHTASHPMLADPGLLYGSRHSLDSRPEADQRWRPPELPEVIEYLSHPNDAIKANAAAYLQHLCYGNNDVKSRTRSLQGIPPLVDLLHNDIPEVHRNALGSLLNLSRGYENDDNKRAMKSAGGIEALATLLERSGDHDVRELITGILWNMSSLGELKKPIIMSALNPLVRSVILPAARLGNAARQAYPDDDNISWSTEFRNATGVLRNVSSDGPFARKHLRECDGLIEALLKVTHAVLNTQEKDNKPVENVVCTLRNLSFRLMEVDYPDYYDKKAKELQQPPKPRSKPSIKDDGILGCFGKSKEQPKNTIEYPCRTRVGRRIGEQLWQPELVEMYLPLLSDCSNTDTLEAAIGAVQNLTACEWQPSVQFREHMRKMRGLPTIVELLGLEEADNVVCGAAIALRNLALDSSNKILIGKYAIQQLVMKLPRPDGNHGEPSRASEETVRAVLATLHEVFKERDADSCEHASTLVNDSDGLSRIMFIAKSRKKYMAKTLRSAHQLLTALWRFTSLRESYRSKGYKESDFLSKTMVPRTGGGNTGTMSVTSTLTRPRSEPPSNSNTIARSNVAFRDDRSDERTLDNRSYNPNYPPTTNNGTLPIQRPAYLSQQNEDQLFQQPTNTYSNPPPNNHNSGGSYRYQESGSYRQQASQPDNYTYQPHSGGSGSYRQPSYRQQSYDANYPPEDGYPTSGHGYPTAEGQSNTDTYANHPFNQSSLHFSQSREGLLPNEPDQYGQPQAEPLYARVDKRKSGHTNQAFHNPNYKHTNAISMESLNDRGNYSFQAPAPADNSNGVDSWV